jgi:hypothetical protein
LILAPRNDRFPKRPTGDGDKTFLFKDFVNRPAKPLYAARPMV